MRIKTFALGLLASATAQAAPVSAPAIALTEGQGVRLSRSVFVDGQGALHDTDEGVLEVNPGRLAALTGRSRGYLHVVTDLGAVAVNVPVDLNPGVPPLLARLGVRATQAPTTQVPFALASADPVPFLAARVVYTASPVLDSLTFANQVGGAPLTWPLNVQTEVIGGAGPGDIQAPAAPPIPDPLPQPQKGKNYESGFNPEYQYTLPWVLNVNAASRQCGPAAAANVFAYLDKVYTPWGIDFPHIHAAAVAGVNGTFVGELDDRMDRVVTDTCNGQNTLHCNAPGDADPSSYIRGIFEYLDAWDGAGQLTVQHQGGDAAYPGDCGGNGDHESTREGNDVTFEWLCDRVQAGSGIILTVGYYDWDYINTVDEEGQFGGFFVYTRTGGHMLRVYGCGEVAGQRYLRTVDDGQQDRMIDTDDDDEADLCEERDGLRTQFWTIGNSPVEGRMTMGSHTRQIENAIAITPDL